MTNIKKFGLQFDGKILGVEECSNYDRDCCEAITYELSNTSEKMWLVDDINLANYVRNVTTPWFNADYESPINPYTSEDLQIVVVSITTYVSTIDIEPITPLQFYTWKFGPGGIYENEYMFSQCITPDRKGKVCIPSWYDIKEYIQIHKKDQS